MRSRSSSGLVIKHSVCLTLLLGLFLLFHLAPAQPVDPRPADEDDADDASQLRQLKTRAKLGTLLKRSVRHEGGGVGVGVGGGASKRATTPKKAAVTQEQREMDDYMAKVNRMEYEDIDEMLNMLERPHKSVSPWETLEMERRMLERLRQYDELRQTVREMSPYLREDLHVGDDDDDDGGDGDDDGDDDDDDDDDEGTMELRKRMEMVDKEDDWLAAAAAGADALYSDALGLDLDADGPFLTSRRRLYPDDPAMDSYDDDVNDAKLSMTKKDLESLVYQADPALTVHQLPAEPQISFRKFAAVDAATVTPPAAEAAEATTARPPHGMKEAVMLRPAAGTKSPLDQLAEREQLRQLAALADADETSREWGEKEVEPERRRRKRRQF